jgi:hypothetical protein
MDLKKMPQSVHRQAVDLGIAPTGLFARNELAIGVPLIVKDVLHTPGQPLDPVTLHLMRSRFGHDFSHVRVHADAPAAASAQAVNAQAYTVGHDIVFGAGQYAPESLAGRRLLAHELTHVIQQGSLGSSLGRLRIGSSQDASEDEANRVSSGVSSQISPSVTHGCMLQRQPEQQIRTAQPTEEDYAEFAAAQKEFSQERREANLERARMNVLRISRLLTVWLGLYRSSSDSKARTEIRASIRDLESELASALQDSNVELQQAISRSAPSAKSTLQRELTENQADLAALRLIFSHERMAQFAEEYQKDLEKLHCMGAAYSGIGKLYGEAESAAIQKSVKTQARKTLKRTRSKKNPKGINIDQFITVLQTLRQRGEAGNQLTSVYNQKHDRWEPPLQKLLLGQVDPSMPGYYFFGFAPVEAFHSVILLVDTWESSTPVIYWCDQYGRERIEDLDAYTQEQVKYWQKTHLLKYRVRKSMLWPLIPPAEAGISGTQ